MDTTEVNSTSLNIQPATIDDAPFIAHSVITAVGIDHPDSHLLDVMQQICADPHTLYSWRNTLVATTAAGETVGSITSYNGNHYTSMRTLTFDTVRQATGQDFSHMDTEAYPGEYYLDSLAVLPRWRGKGIGTMLLKAAIAHAQGEGMDTVTLACEPHNTRAYNLYTSLGFRRTTSLHIFGEDYWKMEKKL